jgi:serine/threonine protein kinase
MDDIPEVKTFADNLNPLPVGTHLQEFVLEKLVGIGGFGIVYRANDTLLGRSVAIKEYMPTSMASRQDGATVNVRSQAYTQDFESGKRSFINEARMLAKFKHSALIEVFRFWEQNGTAYMATPFYEGQTLKEKLQAENAPAADQSYILKILHPILDALETMHIQHVFHRDISPDNIMVLPDGRPILLDLGAARKVLEGGSQALTVMVKPGYAPIEQYADDATVKQGPWTDIYALGAVIHFAITGKAPPPAASRLLKDAMPRLQDRETVGFSTEFLIAADAALRVRPEDRPQTIAEFRNLLEGDASTSPLSASESSSVISLDTASEALLLPTAAMDTDRTIVLPRTLTKSMLTKKEEIAPVKPELAVDLSKEVRSKQSTLKFKAAVFAALGILGVALWFFSTPGTVDAPSSVAVTVPVPMIVPAREPAKDLPKPEEVVQALPAVTPALAPNSQPTAEPTGDTVVKAEKPAMLKLNIKPWGEVFIAGASKGISPPMKSLNLPAGEYDIEIRNGDFPSYSAKLNLKSGEPMSVSHSFSDVAPSK